MMARPKKSASTIAPLPERRSAHELGKGSTGISVTLVRSVPSSATAVAVPAFADRLGKVEGVRKAVLDRAGFGGQPGQSMLLDDGVQARVVIGMGAFAEVSTDSVRRAGAAFVRALGGHRKAAFELPSALAIDESAVVGALAEGLMLAGYRFDAYRSQPPRGGLDAVSIVVADPRAARAALAHATAVANGVTFARNLVNEPGGSLTPAAFAEVITERGSSSGLTVEVLDLAAITAAGLGGIVAVNKGSVHEPRLVHLTYEPDGGADLGEDGEPITVALVGKGITFDSGGLSLKTADGMMDMKCDMAGAAAVVGAMCALAELGVSVRVESWTPLSDNMTGGDAQRPGDIYTARNGRTVEVLNTDAEGRLVLADALALATETSPAAVIDLATLTGACMVALGDKIAGLLGNNADLISKVSTAAATAGERVWHLPLPADYRSLLDSSIADLKNIGSRFGGTLTAGLFLQEFVANDVPWVHLDIAGPAFASAADGENPKGGTGFGVRTLISLLEAFGRDGEELGD